MTKGRVAFETRQPFLSSSWKTGKNNQFHREICHWAVSVILLSDQLVFMSESFSFPVPEVQVQTSAMLSQQWSISLLRHQHIPLMNSQQGKWSLKSSCPATHAQFVNWRKDAATGATGVTCPLPEYSHLSGPFCIQHEVTIGVHRGFQQHPSPSLTSAWYCCHVLSQKSSHLHTGVSFQGHFNSWCKGTDVVLLSLDQPSASLCHLKTERPRVSWVCLGLLPHFAGSDRDS